MSLAVVYRSMARLHSDLRQIRSSSLSMRSSIWRGGTASTLVISCNSSDADSAMKGRRLTRSW